VKRDSLGRGPLALLALAAVVSLVGTFALAVFGELLFEPPSAGADAFSRSALGHRAFLDLARKEGFRVLVSRHRTQDRAREGALTALLEPAAGEEDGGRTGAVLSGIRSSARRLLVVLPKRSGDPDPLRPAWLGSVRDRSVAEAERVLTALSLDAQVVRPTSSVLAFEGALPAPEVDNVQLVRSKDLRPLLASSEGMLVAELVSKRSRVIVVSDPDVLENHGLSRGRNAELSLAVLQRFGGEPVLVVDETLHGHEIEPSITRELLRFPLVLATLQALAALFLLAWAALVRFGRPVPPAPLLKPGKAFLIEHTAELLRAGGHAGEAARAYLRTAREEVLARLPPPGGAESASAWLERLEAARGRAGSYRRLEERVAGIAEKGRGALAEVVRAAQEISRWREELTDGTRGDPGTRRGAQG